ncbi:MAG: hypothetical protein E6I60_11960 [Chloroflexi bacterium]|nr:MAG: hypothetical protein E6I60_11960 [Chloroflexota bacterium]
MRIRVIVLGALGALALATLSANAGNQATPRVQGSVVSLVAATTTVVKADRDAASAATHEETTQSVSKPVVALKPAAPKITVSAACQQAINNLRALHQADLAKDAAERAAAQQPLLASALRAALAEDLAEAQQWRNALTAARTACVPQPSAACQAAIAALQAKLVSLRTAVAAVVTACGQRD